MKDFDFDELDRAVSSVLSTKDTDAADPGSSTLADQTITATSDAGSDTPVQPTNGDAESTDYSAESVTAHVESPDVSNIEEDDSPASNDEMHSEMIPESSAEPQDTAVQVTIDSHEAEMPDAASESIEPEVTAPMVEAPTPETPNESEAVSKPDTGSLAEIPVKRGKFMDVVAPGSIEPKKPISTHTAVTIAPSSDFKAEEAAPADPVVETIPQAVPEIDVVQEPETHEADEAGSDPAVAAVDTSDTTPAQDNGVTPFIPDVPVDKRPLNPGTGDAVISDTTTEQSSSTSIEPVADDTSTTATPDAMPTDQVLAGSVPKEFNKDIMAVEANETVGAASDVISKDGDVAAAAHPLFDTTSLAGHEAVAKHHGPSKMTWIIVGSSLFIVGAALGVLYFLYGQV